MINTIVSGFCEKWNIKAIEKLEQDQVIKICKWIGYNDEGFDKKENSIAWWDIVLEEKYPTEHALTDLEWEYIKPYLPIMEQQMVREKMFELEPLYEVHNVIVKFLEYFKKVIIEQSVQLILFADAPHGSFNYALYQIAHCLGVKTIICMPSFWVGRAFILDDLQDIGLLPTDNYAAAVEEKIEKKFQKRLPYMDKQTTSEKLKEKTKLFWNFGGVIKERRESFNRNFRNYGTWSRYIFTHIQRFCKRHIENTEYTRSYRKKFCETTNENEKFVYFPLHLQPEMTTDTLGGKYYDQLLAIEKLRKILPKDWYIYVKENPLQEEYMRGRSFFDRLKCIPKVRMLGKDVNTYKLMEKCEFVATITGTAGWEAITGGKTALIFGLAWYRNLPGVFMYHDGMNIEPLLQFKYDKELLEKQAALLKATTQEIVLEEYAFNQLHVDIQENNMNIYTMLRQRIELIDGVAK